MPRRSSSGKFFIIRELALVFLLLVSFGGVTTADALAVRPLANDPSGARWADRTLRKMSLEEKVGQLFMIWAKVDFMNFAGPDYVNLRDTMKKYHLGAFGITSPMESGLLVKGSPLEAAALTNQLQRDSELPLLFAADFERGLPMRFHGGTMFPHAMAFGATGNAEYAYQYGRITAMEARSVGVQWNFYPDADVNSNPSNPVINTRSFGEDPAEVSELVKAYIRGVHNARCMATAKHFPGHGDTDTDSHLSVSRVSASRERLDQVELVPFRAAIAAGVDSVMVGHLAVPSLEPNPNRVASISHNITTKLLKEELGFRGMVVTDAMEMNGLTRLFGGNSSKSSGLAAVEALKAGADYIIIPGDLDGAYNGILDAVKRGEISKSRIDESVGKILRAKAALGLHKNRFVDLKAVSDEVSRPENVVLAQKIADDAVTIVREGTRENPREGRTLLPLSRSAAVVQEYAYHSAVAAGNHLLVLIFTDDSRSENGRALAREVRTRMPDARIMYVDDQLAPLVASQVLEAAVNAERVLAAVFGAPSPGRTVDGNTASPSLERGPSDVLASVIEAANDKTIVVALGNPYIIAQYPTIENYICTFSSAPVSELSAVKFVFGEIPARGRLPVTIPGIAARVPMKLEAVH
jgi:beta-N-acetylhexosaminidase